MADLETRVARLELVDALRELKLHYAVLCDAGYDGAAISRLFTDDAVWDGGESFGRYEGVDEIQQFFAGLGNEIAWALHYMIGPVDVKISSDFASAEAGWYLWMPYVAVEDGRRRSRLFAAKQRDRYRFEAGKWKFSEIVVSTESIGEATEGWLREREP
jgi:SnoaL-like domain